MRDLTCRALDTATALGATYADVRVVRRIEESINIKSGRVEGVAVGRDRGLRRPRPRRRGLGLRGEPPPAPPPRPTASRPRPSGSPGRARPPSGPPSRLDDRPPAHGRFETPVEEDPFAVPLERKIADLLAADAALNEVNGIAWTESPVRGPARGEDVRGERRLLHRAGHHPRRRGPRGERHRRRRAPAPQLSRTTAALWASAGYEFVRGMDLAGNAERIASEAVELLSGAAAARRARARSSSTRASCTCRSTRAAATRPSSTARSAPRRATPARASSRPDMLGGFRYGSDLCDIVADATVAGGLGTFGWDDEGVAAQRVPIDQGGHVRRLPVSSRETAPRIGRQSGGAMRADGWNRIPLIRMTNVNLLPRDGHDLRRHRRGHRRRPPVRDQPQLVDRRPAPELPVRHRDLPRDQGRQAGQAYRNGTYTGITYELWRSMDAVGDASSWRDVGHAELRQGRAGPDRPRRARRLGRAVPQRPGGGDG